MKVPGKTIERRRHGADPPRAAGKLRGVVLLGGGTGGHLVPGLALAELLEETHPACRVTLFRTRRSIEDRFSGERGVETVLLDLDPPGRSLRGRLRFLRQVGRGLATVRRHLARHPVDVAVGLGGYASVPGILAARLEGIPLVLLEQNASPGRVNRLLGCLADFVACPGPESIARFGALRSLIRLRETGSPLRRRVASAARWRRLRTPPERRRELGGGSRRILLVMGGSQGARSINLAVVRALPSLENYRDRIFCIHVTGNADKEWVEDAYRQAGWSSRVVAFEADLPALLGAADLVLARAGGTTLAELGAIGVPSVLVPYPAHRDRHQFDNARTLEGIGAALLVEESFLDGPGLLTTVNCLFDDETLEAMGRAALKGARVDGSEQVLRLLEEVTGDLEERGAER